MTVTSCGEVGFCGGWQIILFFFHVHALVVLPRYIAVLIVVLAVVAMSVFLIAGVHTICSPFLGNGYVH